MNEQITKDAQQTIVKAEPESESLAIYLRRPDITDKLAMIVGSNENALRCIQSVILLVELSEPGEYSLKNCSKRSIANCMFKAAVQNVTVNPEDRQAFMIPNYNNKKKDANGNSVMEARFQFHYQEIYNRAMRTFRYSVINVSPVPDDVEVMEDYATGMIYLAHKNGLTEDPRPQTQLRLRPYSDRQKPRQGWLGYYRTRQGAERMIYLSLEEIERRANFNKAHARSFGWKDHRETMEMKTTLLALLRLADTKAEDMKEVKAALETIDNTEGETDEQPGDENEVTQDAEVEEIHDDENQESDEQRADAADEYIEVTQVRKKSDFKQTQDAIIGDLFSQDTPSEKVTRTALPEPRESTIKIGNVMLKDMYPDELQAIVDDPQKQDGLKVTVKKVLAWKLSLAK